MIGGCENHLCLELLLPVRQQVDLHVRVGEAVSVLRWQIESFQDLHHQLLRTEKHTTKETCVTIFTHLFKIKRVMNDRKKEI